MYQCWRLWSFHLFFMHVCVRVCVWWGGGGWRGGWNKLDCWHFETRFTRLKDSLFLLIKKLISLNPHLTRLVNGRATASSRGRVRAEEMGGSLFVLLLLFFWPWSIFCPQHPFHPRVTAIVRKRSQSFCQKCRWHSLWPWLTHWVGGYHDDILLAAYQGCFAMKQLNWHQ